MLGAIFSLLSSITFGLNSAVNRRVLMRASSVYVANISILSGLPFFLIFTLLFGQLFNILTYPWQVYAYFSIGGVIHFAFGRTWNYKSIQLIGATRSGVVTSMSFVVTIALSVLILGEQVTTLSAIGILLALIGPVLISVKESKKGQGEAESEARVDRKTLLIGIIYGLGAAVMWGTSIIFTKLALDAGGQPITGNLIAYAAATIAIIPSIFLNTKNRDNLLQTRGNVLKFAVTSNVAQMLRYLALGSASDPGEHFTAHHTALDAGSGLFLQP